MKIAVPVTFFALIFGGIHCLRWFFVFPSHTEAVLWRISSATITVAVLAMWVGFLIGLFLHYYARTSSFSGKYYYSVILPSTFSNDIVFVTVYISARTFRLLLRLDTFLYAQLLLSHGRTLYLISN